MPKKGRSWGNVYFDWWLSHTTSCEDASYRYTKQKTFAELNLAHHFSIFKQYFGEGIFVLLPEDMTGV